jgi:hypothetical protein
LPGREVKIQASSPRRRCAGFSFYIGYLSPFFLLFPRRSAGRLFRFDIEVHGLQSSQESCPIISLDG